MVETKLNRHDRRARAALGIEIRHLSQAEAIRLVFDTLSGKVRQPKGKRLM